MSITSTTTKSVPVLLQLGAKSLRELRIHLCQTSPASAGTRSFIDQHYVQLKKNNQHFPILIRECSGIMPRIWARYEFGEETSVSLENVSSDKVLAIVKELATK